MLHQSSTNIKRYAKATGLFTINRVAKTDSTYYGAMVAREAVKRYSEN
jgi:hypothetical protein